MDTDAVGGFGFEGVAAWAGAAEDAGTAPAVRPGSVTEDDVAGAVVVLSAEAAGVEEDEDDDNDDTDNGGSSVLERKSEVAAENEGDAGGVVESAVSSAIKVATECGESTSVAQSTGVQGVEVCNPRSE